MQEIELLGAPGSPYTRKMLALLRYRRIRYRMVWGAHSDPPAGYPTPKVKLLPTFYFPTPNGLEAMVDSTPIIQRLELAYEDRSVIPDHPVLQFINLLIEDFADEWLTKAMFHYRWHYAEDAAHAAPWLIYSQYPQMSEASAKKMAATFAQRQISRLNMVGSNESTAPVIESSFQRLISIMDGLIEHQGFVLGNRPASADFAIYGQLTQLGMFDPTPTRFLEKTSPRLRAWLDRMEDLSGHSASDWISTTSIGDPLFALLKEIGHFYAPFLLANHHSISQGLDEFETPIDGRQWKQPVFPYQAKCLEALRKFRQDMSDKDRYELDLLLKGSGCETLFA